MDVQWASQSRHAQHLSQYPSPPVSASHCLPNLSEMQICPSFAQPWTWESSPLTSPHLSLAVNPTDSYLHSGSGIRPHLCQHPDHLSSDWAQWSLPALPASHYPRLPHFNRVTLLQHESNHVTVFPRTRRLPITPGIRATIIIGYRALRAPALSLPLLPSLLLLILDHSASVTMPSLLSAFLPGICISFRSRLGCHLLSETFHPLLKEHLKCFIFK